MTVQSTTPKVVRPNPRLRWSGSGVRQYAHLSGNPLVYLSASPALAAALRRPTLPAGWLGTSAGDHAFLAALLRAGVVYAGDQLDPIHTLGPDDPRSATLTLFPSDSCNLRCVYCYASSGPGAGPRMRSTDAIAAIDAFLAGLGAQVTQVILAFHGGGEPTTNLPVMIAAWEHLRTRCAELGLRARAQTISNGTFGGPARQFLIANRFAVTLSYDGPLQDRQRPTAAGRASRERVVANIAALRAAGLPVGARATLTRAGLEQLPQAVADAVAVGLTRLQVEPASGLGRGGDLADTLGLPTPQEFAAAFLAVLPDAVAAGLILTTAAWSSTRMGTGRFCMVQTDGLAVTPDGVISTCVEVTDGSDPDNPLLIGRLDAAGRKLLIDPAREARLRARVGYELPGCADCYMVDTCAGGCASKALAAGGTADSRDQAHCELTRLLNPPLIAAIADGELVPEDGWLPLAATLSTTDSGRPDASATPGMWGRMVGLVPRHAQPAWLADPQRRPMFATRGRQWFTLGRGRPGTEAPTAPATGRR